MDPKQVAETILQQMGGANRLKLMVGTKHFSFSSDYSLTFDFKMCKQANYLTIKLEADDTYTMKFLKCSLKAGTLKAGNRKVVETFVGVYAEDLVPIFKRFTGLELTIPRIVGINA